MVGQPVQMVTGWAVLRFAFCDFMEDGVLLLAQADDGSRGLFSSRVRHGRCEAGCHSAQEACCLG